MPYRTICLFLFSLTSAFSQVVIEGTVRDAVTLAPIPGATAAIPGPPDWGELVELGQKARGPFVPEPVTGSEFRIVMLRAGGTLLTVRAEGYRPEHKFLNGQPLQKFDVLLTRSVSVTGRVVDKDTGVPIKDVYVRMAKPDVATSIMGHDSPTKIQFSDADGRFRIDGASAGEFVLRLVAQYPPQDGPRTSGYSMQWWPGGVTLDMSHPLRAEPGTALDVGDIPLERQQFHSVTGTLHVENCVGSPTVGLIRPNGGFLSLIGNASVKCGGEFVFSNVPAGRYYLVMRPSIYSTNPVAARQLDVTDQSVKTDLVPVPQSQFSKEAVPDNVREVILGRREAW